VLVKLEELREIEELALCGLRSKITWRVTAWTDRSLEHEVEGHRWGGFDAGIRVLKLVLLDQLTKFLAIIVINLRKLVFALEELW
jgi:hypothetical protein